MNISWKMVVFDFDDTLYMKTSYDFVPHVCEMLTLCSGIPLILLTYNTKALSIMRSIGLENYFDYIIMIASKQQRKSTVISDHPCFRNVMNKSEILFFDNDPFNVYDMETVGVTSFLVNPITGLTKDLLGKIIRLDFASIYVNGMTLIHRTYNYVDRTTISQNLQVIHKFYRPPY